MAPAWPAGNYTLRAHVLVADDSLDGYTPMDVIGRNVPLDLECQEVQPTATAKPPTPKPTDNGGVAPTTGTHQGADQDAAADRYA